MLEHVDRDLGIIRLWRDATWCVCSVPNFDYAGHVRFFNTTGEVTTHYGGLIDIEGIIKIPPPIIPDHRIASCFQNFPWSRNNLKDPIGFLVIQTFSRVGGGFLF